MKLIPSLCVFATLARRAASSKNLKDILLSKRKTLQLWKEESEYLYGPVISKAAKSRVQVTGPPPKPTKVAKEKKSTKNVSKRKEESKLIVANSACSNLILPAVSHETHCLESLYQRPTDAGELSNIDEKISKREPVIKQNAISIEEEFCDIQEASKDDLEQIKKAKLIKADQNTSDKVVEQPVSSPKESQKLLLNHILKTPLDSKTNDDCLNIWKNVPTPSVSKILKDSMSEESQMVLQRWEKSMIESLGKEGFEKFKMDMLNTGTKLHSSLNKFLESQTLEAVAPEIEGYWNSLQPVLKDITDVVAMEQMVVNTTLNYKGYFDCIATYQGKPCLIEWKTSRKSKPTIDKTFDNPLQVVAYLSAFNKSLLEDRFKNTNLFQHQILRDHGISKSGKLLDNCLIVVSYSDGSKADVHFMNQKMCEKYWTQWLRRLHVYWSRYFKTQ